MPSRVAWTGKRLEFLADMCRDKISENSITGEQGEVAELDRCRPRRAPFMSQTRHEYPVRNICEVSNNNIPRCNLTGSGASGGRQLAPDSGRALVQLPRRPFGASPSVAQPTQQVGQAA